MLQLDMASILSLNDDCVRSIISFIDDPRSFYNFALTCKRFPEVTRNTANTLHANVLFAKAEYYLKCYVVDITNGIDWGTQAWMDGYEKYCNLRERLHESARLTAATEMLTYAKVIDVWQNNGPVSAELFTWIRNQETTREKRLRDSSFTEYRSVTLHLPSCDKDIVFDTMYLNDFPDDTINHDEITMRVTCGDLHVTWTGTSRYCPEDYTDELMNELYEDEFRDAVASMKPVMELLQKELGKTVPPITNYFFTWLCHFFPDMKNVPNEHKLRFEDPVRNEKPSTDSVESAIHLFHQNLQAKTKMKNLVSIWKNDDEQAPNYFNVIVETIYLLAQRLEVKSLERLEAIASSFYHIVADYDMRLLPKQLLLQLVLRTSLEGSCYIRAAASLSKVIESKASFRCLGSKVVNVWGRLHGNGGTRMTSKKLELQFTLPDGKVLRLNVDAEDMDYSAKERPSPADQLSPVAALLQEYIDQSTEEDNNIQIHTNNNIHTNHFVAVYFLHSLRFSDAEHTFFKIRKGRRRQMQRGLLINRHLRTVNHNSLFSHVKFLA